MNGTLVDFSSAFDAQEPGDSANAAALPLPASGFPQLAAITWSMLRSHGFTQPALHCCFSSIFTHSDVPSERDLLCFALGLGMIRPGHSALCATSMAPWHNSNARRKVKMASPRVLWSPDLLPQRGSYWENYCCHLAATAKLRRLLR